MEYSILEQTNSPKENTYMASNQWTIVNERHRILTYFSFLPLIGRFLDPDYSYWLSLDWSGSPLSRPMYYYTRYIGLAFICLLFPHASSIDRIHWSGTISKYRCCNVYELKSFSLIWMNIYSKGLTINNGHCGFYKFKINKQR